MWILGDSFLSRIFNEYLEIKAFKMDKPPLYMEEFFNVKPLFKSHFTTKLVSSRILNELIKAINVKDSRLPKYLLVILDGDLIKDIPDTCHPNSGSILRMVTTWLVKQISNVIRRKRIDLYEKKPGAVAGYHTKIIYVKMIRRVGKIHDSSALGAACTLRPKFNDSLNDAVVKMNEYILTINMVSHFEDFDHLGHLTKRGKAGFWAGVDDLL